MGTAALTYYVAPPPVGNDKGGHTGLSEDQAFATIGRAAGLTNPGDTVLVRNGTYTNSCPQCNVVSVTRSGTADAWITYANYPGESPKLQYNGWNAFGITGNYIEVRGFTIQGNVGNVTLAYAQAHQNEYATNPLLSGNAIAIQATTITHHVRILNNILYENGCSGVGTVNADYLTIENNIVFRNAYWSPYGCSGISTLINANSDNSTATKMFIRGNIVYSNEEYIPVTSGGSATPQITDGNGIIIDTSRNNAPGNSQIAYLGRTLIENNLVFDNGGRGIHAYQSDHIDIVNNTVYFSGRSPAISGGEVTVIHSGDVNVINNILVARTGKPVDTLSAATGTMLDYNIAFNGTYSGAGAHDLVAVDPQFIEPSTDPTVADFHLLASSPARDSGSATPAPATDLDGVARPQGSGFDRGAFEFDQSAAYIPLQPARILDTRSGYATSDGKFAGVGALGAGVTLNVDALGRANIAPSGVKAVVLNITATNPTANGYITVWPAGAKQPLSSNLNFTPGQTIPNLVIAKVGSNGQIALFNSSGNTDLIADVMGYFTSASAINAISPLRLLDTRAGAATIDSLPVQIGPVNGAGSIDLPIFGRGGLPASGIGAAVLNVTVTNPGAPGYITVWPSATARPFTSNLNFIAGQTIPNLVISSLGSNGKVGLFNAAALPTDLIADIQAWFPTTSELTSVSPARILDTRPNAQTVDTQFAGVGAVQAGSTLNVTILGRGGVPLTGVGAVVLNVTATEPSSNAYITVWPSGATQPVTSNLNVTAGQTIPNLVIVKVGSNGQVAFFNSAGSTQLVADVVGWFPQIP
jgi:parallel beta-helix repeat protein